MGWKASVGGCRETKVNQQVREREEKQQVETLGEENQGQLSGHINADGKRTLLWLPLVEHTHTGRYFYWKDLCRYNAFHCPYLNPNTNRILLSAFKPRLNSQTGPGRCEDQPHFAGRMLILVLSM